MLGDLSHRLHRRGELMHQTVEGAILNAGAVIVTVFTIVILFFGIFAFRAS
jgi:hypothetical protein